MKFPRGIDAWGTAEFKSELEDELECQRHEFDFDDCAPTGCQDMVDREKARAFFTLTIDKKTGDGEIEPDKEARFNPEYY
jgi:hypothetical protein